MLLPRSRLSELDKSYFSRVTASMKRGPSLFPGDAADPLNYCWERSGRMTQEGCPPSLSHTHTSTRVKGGGAGETPPDNLFPMTL